MVITPQRIEVAGPIIANHFSANTFTSAPKNEPLYPRWSHPGSMSSSSSSACSSNWSPGSSRSSLPPGVHPIAMPAVKPELIDQDIPFSAFQHSLSLSQQPLATQPGHPAHHPSKHPASPLKTKTSKRPKKHVGTKDNNDDDGTEEDDPDIAVVSDGEGLDLTEYNGVPKRKLSLKTRNRLKQRAHRERRALHLSTLESQVSELTELKAQKEFDDRMVAQLQFELSTNSALLAASESQRIAYEGMIREAERQDREQRTIIRLLEGEVTRLRSIMMTVPVNASITMNTPPDSQSTKTSIVESEHEQTTGWTSSDAQLELTSSSSSSAPTPAVSLDWNSKDTSTTQHSPPTTTILEESFFSKDPRSEPLISQDPSFSNQILPTQHPFNPQGNIQHPNHSLYNPTHYYYPYNPYATQPPFYSQAGSYPNVLATARPPPTNLFPPHLRPQSINPTEGPETHNLASASMAKRNSDSGLPYSPARTTTSRASVMSDPTGRSPPHVPSLPTRNLSVAPQPAPPVNPADTKPTVQVTSPTLSDTQSNPKARLANLPHLQTSFLGAPLPISNDETDSERLQTEHPFLRSQTTGATSLHIPGPSPISAYGLSVPGGLWGGPPTGFPPFTPSGATSSMYPISAGPGGTLGNGLSSGSGIGTGPWPWSLSGFGLSPKGADREGEWEFGLAEEKTPMGGLTSSMEHQIKGSPEKMHPPKANLLNQS